MSNVCIISINAKYIHTPLAALSLAANCGARVFDFNINQNEDYILMQICAAKPKVAAFSCYIWNIGIVKRLIPVIKALLPNTLIVLGGPEVTYNAECYTEQGVLVIKGEGEAAFASLIKYLEKSGYLSNNNAAAPPLDDIRKNTGLDNTTPPKLECISFAYDGYDFPKGKIVYYETQRGCPFNCSYCLQSASFKDEKPCIPHRELPLSRVLKELRFLLNKQVPQVKLTDRTFNANRERAFEIWKFLANNDNGCTNFHFEVSADLLEKEDIVFLKTVRRGLFRFEAGVQSTNLKTLAAVNRTASPKAILTNIREISKAGNIHTHISLIAGLPLESYSSFAKTYNDAMNAKPNTLQLGFLKLLHGSALRNAALAYGIVYREHPPYEVLKTNAITANELFTLKKTDKLTDTFYNSGAFVNSMAFFHNAFETPFKFYEALCFYYDKNGLFDCSHKRDALYAQLLAFAFENGLDAKDAVYADMTVNGLVPQRLFEENTRADVKKLLRLLDKHYPFENKCYLNYSKPYELLFATILSAQCTDERVNTVTKTLFAKYTSLQAFANADLNELEELVKPTGFYKNKAKNIKNAAITIIKEHSGELPHSLDLLTALPGVGRKTANVVRGHIFGIPSIVVDTHVARVSARLTLITNTEPVKAEFELMKILPKKAWIRFNTQLIAHGRLICRARNPKCGECFLASGCPGRITR